jgi:hypothetical protein
VNLISFTYEQLYHEDDATPWNKILESIGVEGRNLRWDDVVASMEHADTSTIWHSDSIKNFEEVKEALQGTPFEGLLREENTD